MDSFGLIERPTGWTYRGGYFIEPDIPSRDMVGSPCFSVEGFPAAAYAGIDVLALLYGFGYLVAGGHGFHLMREASLVWPCLVA